MWQHSSYSDFVSEYWFKSASLDTLLNTQQYSDENLNSPFLTAHFEQWWRLLSFTKIEIFDLLRNSNNTFVDGMARFRTLYSMCVCAHRWMK